MIKPIYREAIGTKEVVWQYNFFFINESELCGIIRTAYKNEIYLSKVYSPKNVAFRYNQD